MRLGNPITHFVGRRTGRALERGRVIIEEEICTCIYNTIGEFIATIKRCTHS